LLLYRKWHEKDQEYNTVIRTYQTTKSAELNQLVDLKTQNSKFTEDNSRLTDENARLKSQVEGLGPSEAERQLRERVATLEADVASLHKAAAAEKRRADEARRNVEKHKKEAEQYLKEVDALAMEMDTLGQQNVDLQRKAVEADDVRMKVMTSNMKQSFLQSEAQRENQRLQGIVQTKTDKINSLDELIRSLNATITQYSNDVAAANLEKSKALTALEETDKAFKGTLALLDASRLRCTKLMEDMKELREKVAQVEISKVALESQKTKAQEDLTNTQRRLKEKSSLSSSTGASVGGRANQALQSQVELYKVGLRLIPINISTVF
jgi:chromosome segregation ATPase